MVHSAYAQIVVLGRLEGVSLRIIALKNFKIFLLKLIKGKRGMFIVFVLRFIPQRVLVSKALLPLPKRVRAHVPCYQSYDWHAFGLRALKNLIKNVWERS